MVSYCWDMTGGYKGEVVWSETDRGREMEGSERETYRREKERWTGERQTREKKMRKKEGRVLSHSSSRSFHVKWIKGEHFRLEKGSGR